VVAVRCRRALNHALDRLDTRSGGDPRPLEQPPVFIVGAPRSGSTLLYQLLVEVLEVGYLSNRHCRLWGSPALVERLARPSRATSHTYDSSHGGTTGAGAPSECGEYWYRYFRRRPHYVPLAEADPARLRALRASVRRLGAAAGRPLLFKNLYCTLRLEPIAAALPEAAFLLIRRDLVDNAHSILEARKRIHGDYDAWWSAEPPEIERLRTLPPEVQAVEQVRTVEAAVERARVASPDRFLELRYEELCDDPRAAVDEVEAFLAGLGIPVSRRNIAPESFQQRTGIRIDSPLYERLVAYARGVE
jgi:LPS sulfotransferase NodH